jgi:hypothetical protein
MQPRRDARRPIFFHANKAEQTIEHSRFHGVPAGKTVARKGHERVLKDRALAMKKMLEKQIKNAAAEHDQREQRCAELITPPDQKQGYTNGSGSQPSQGPDE